jgi:hypothetical protein
VYEVWPVPPLTTARVPPNVSVPLVVIGDPVNVSPVVPPDAATDVTVPPVGGGATTRGATKSLKAEMLANASFAEAPAVAAEVLISSSMNVSIESTVENSFSNCLTCSKSLKNDAS